VRLQQGFDLADLQHVLGVTERVLNELYFGHFADAGERRRAIEHVYAISETARTAMFKAYVKAQQQALADQAELIRRLSTPILPLLQGLLVLPLIGELDAGRAAQAMERLLESVVEHRASLTIIDVTGIPTIDVEMARYLIMAAQAVRLLGARVVVAGISASVAKAMVELGIELGDVATYSNLQAAVKHALAELSLGLPFQKRP
jgi:rsbT co-antagonist protein RsbR